MSKSLSFQLSPISLFCLISHFYLLFLLTWHISLFIWTYFVWSINNAVIVSSEQQSDSPIPKKNCIKKHFQVHSKIEGKAQRFPTSLLLSHVFPVPPPRYLHPLSEWDIHSVQFSCSVMFDSLRPHGLQHIRFPCPSTPRACSNSCPSQWCHPTISSSVVPFSSCS